MQSVLKSATTPATLNSSKFGTNVRDARAFVLFGMRMGRVSPGGGSTAHDLKTSSQPLACALGRASRPSEPPRL